MADLSVLIVNYNSGWYCANLVDSLRDQKFTNRQGGPGQLQILVLDNASPQDQHDFLEPLSGQGVQVIYSQDNSGYGGGNNRAMEQVDSDWVMVINPDVVLLPGAIQEMLNPFFEDPQVGMVGPRGWFDPACHFYLPPIEIPSLGAHLFENMGRWFRAVGQRFSLVRSRTALRFWSGTGAMDSDMISGFCFLMPTALAREFGPFDLGFPFYYEDTDLCMRLSRAGYRLVYAKDAKAIHFYNKSAGPVYAEVMEKYHRSKSYFFKKHYGGLADWLMTLSSRLVQRNQRRLMVQQVAECENLGLLAQPVELDLPEGRPVLLELTLDPCYVLAAAHLHPGGIYRMPELTWQALDPNQWFLRVLDREARACIGKYRWEKSSPGLLPPSYASILERVS